MLGPWTLLSSHKLKAFCLVETITLMLAEGGPNVAEMAKLTRMGNEIIAVMSKFIRGGNEREASSDVIL